MKQQKRLAEAKTMYREPSNGKQSEEGDHGSLNVRRTRTMLSLSDLHFMCNLNLKTELRNRNDAAIPFLMMLFLNWHTPTVGYSACKIVKRIVKTCFSLYLVYIILIVITTTSNN